MNQLEKSVTMENKEIHSYLPHINSLLHNAVLTCTAVESSTSFTGDNFKSEQIAPNKKLEHQWRFKPTTAAPGRKKKGLIFRFVLLGLPTNPLTLRISFIDMLTTRKEKKFWRSLKQMKR